MPCVCVSFNKFSSSNLLFLSPSLSFWINTVNIIYLFYQIDRNVKTTQNTNSRKKLFKEVCSEPTKYPIEWNFNFIQHNSRLCRRERFITLIFSRACVCACVRLVATVAAVNIRVDGKFSQFYSFFPTNLCWFNNLYVVIVWELLLDTLFLFVRLRVEPIHLFDWEYKTSFLFVRQSLVLYYYLHLI